MMYDTVQRDLQEIIDILWKRDDVDMWSFDPYKGFCYILMQLYKNKNYQERKSELVLYLEHRFDDWKLYTVQLLIELMHNDSSIASYDRDKLPVCKFKSDLNNAITILQKYHNAFVLAGDLTTDIYHTTIETYKQQRKNLVLKRLRHYREDYEDLYVRLSKYDHILRGIYSHFTKTHSFNSVGCPPEVKKMYELTRPTNKCELYLMWLEYEEDKKNFLNKYYNMRRSIATKKHSSFLAELKVIHKLICSKLYDEVTVIKAWDRDTACELGCPSEEYIPSDWEGVVEFNQDFKKFISNCYIDKCQYYKFIVKDNDKKFILEVKNST